LLERPQRTGLAQGRGDERRQQREDGEEPYHGMTS
jgi:hypothetical protein